jgi:hypothetical protein
MNRRDRDHETFQFIKLPSLLLFFFFFTVPYLHLASQAPFRSLLQVSQSQP